MKDEIRRKLQRMTGEYGVRKESRREKMKERRNRKEGLQIGTEHQIINTILFYFDSPDHWRL